MHTNLYFADTRICRYWGAGMWMEVPPLASPFTSQYLHLSAVLLFSVSTTTLLNFPTDLREFYEGRLLVT